MAIVFHEIPFYCGSFVESLFDMCLWRLVVKLTCSTLLNATTTSLHFYGCLAPDSYSRGQLLSACVRWKAPSSLLESEFFRCLQALAEAAANGSRHQVACLYHCNRQVGPGEWVQCVLMPLSSALAGSSMSNHNGSLLILALVLSLLWPFSICLGFM